MTEPGPRPGARLPTCHSSYSLQVVVNTSARYEVRQQKRNGLHVPRVKKMNISFYSNVSDRAKVGRQLESG